MVVEARRDDYSCEFSSIAESAVQDGDFLQENSQEKTLVWQTEDPVTAGSNGSVRNAWASHIALMDARMRGDVKLFKLRLT